MSHMHTWEPSIRRKTPTWEQSMNDMSMHAPVHACTHPRACTHPCMHARTHAHARTCTHMHAHARACMRMHGHLEAEDERFEGVDGGEDSVRGAFDDAEEHAGAQDALQHDQRHDGRPEHTPGMCACVHVCMCACVSAA